MKKFAIVTGLVLVSSGALWASITAPLPLPQPLRFIARIAVPAPERAPSPMSSVSLDRMVRVHALVASQA